MYLFISSFLLLFLLLFSPPLFFFLFSFFFLLFCNKLLQITVLTTRNINSACQVKIKEVSAPQMISAPKVKRAIPKSSAKTPRLFENQSSTQASMNTSASSSAPPSAFFSVYSSVSSMHHHSDLLRQNRRHPDLFWHRRMQ